MTKSRCATLRPGEFRFYDPAILAEPASAAAILAGGDRRNKKLFDVSLAGSYGFTDSRNPQVAAQTERVMDANTAMTNVVCGLKSMKAALALPMGRQVVAEQRIRDEIDGKTEGPAGTRLMDLLDVRFIAADHPMPTAGLRTFWSDPQLGIYILENTASRPLFQFLPSRSQSVLSTKRCRS